ncbi:MAG: glycosyltransferase family 9 protein [Deltaproteobacteria bacterium]|nr:glycosyltransferase family 9 protein [Deltaproteobacteria bacterium]
MYKIINRKKLAVTIAADVIGRALFLPNFLLKRDRKIMPEEVREILVIRTAYIGDIIMTLPMLKPLKAKYPNSKITFLLSSGAVELLSHNPYIDRVLVYDAFWFFPGRNGAGKEYFEFLKILRCIRFDLVIEARADIRDIALLAFPCRGRYRVSYDFGGGAYMLTHVVPFRDIKHKVEYHLDIARSLGCKVNGIDWGLNLTQKEMNEGRALLQKEGVSDTDTVVGVHPGGRKELKNWHPERYAEAADRLIEECAVRVVFTGSEQERVLIDGILANMKHKAVNLGGRTDLRLLACLIKRYNLFMCNDSAPLHLASALNTPAVAIFGPSKSRETGPYGNIHRIVEKGFPCRSKCDEDVCLHSSFKACMDAVLVSDVFGAAEEVLKETGRYLGGYGVQA